MKQQNKDCSYFSFESATIDLRAIDIYLNIIFDFWVVRHFDGISANKIKLLPDIDDEETKSLDNYEQLQKLKQFIDENQFEFEDDHFIFQLNNIFKVRVSIEQPFDIHLAKAQIFEFHINDNLTNEFKIKEKLIGNVPNFISFWDNQEATDMKIYGPPIYLVLNVSSLTKNTLSIFNELKNKNLFKITWNTPINRDRLLLKESWSTLLNIIKDTDTLKELDIWVVDKTDYNTYSFKNLTKLRKEQIFNAIWGSSLTESSNFIDLNSLKTTGDSITYYN